MFNKITLTTAFVAATGAKTLRMRDGSIPACNSYSCEKDTATTGWDVPTEFTYGQGADFVYRLNQVPSIPACTSHECKKDSVADGYNVPSIAPEIYGPETNFKKLVQRKSIPACDTYGGCKTASVTANYDVPSLYTDYRGDPAHTYGTGYEGTTHVYGLNQQRSIPACNTYGGCKTASVADNYDSPSLNPNNKGLDFTYGHYSGLNQRQSIPACDTYDGCKTDSVASGWNVPTIAPEIYGPETNFKKLTQMKDMTQAELDALILNEQDIAKKAYDYNGVANTVSPNYRSLAQSLRKSVPACNSLGCKKASVADNYDSPSLNPNNKGVDFTYGHYSGLSQRQSVPACDSTGCKTQSINDIYNNPTAYFDHRGEPEHVYRLNQRSSVPACDSTGCKTDTAAADWDVPTIAPVVYGPDLIYSLNQRKSIPACHSAGCKTDTITAGWDVPTMSPEIYGNNGEYTYGTNDHIH